VDARLSTTMSTTTTTMDIDQFAFDGTTPGTCACKSCGTTFRSHARAAMIPDLHLISREPCPGCGSFKLSHYSSVEQLVIWRL
jgi:ribosomal protein L32